MKAKNGGQGNKKREGLRKFAGSFGLASNGLPCLLKLGLGCVLNDRRIMVLTFLKVLLGVALLGAIVCIFGVEFELNKVLGTGWFPQERPE
ncbi:MAG: hypothetical protein R8K46_06490 [Mariprofundaceae bacterium]